VADSRSDAVIVGAGPNGLSAAIVLAQAGLGVTVVEATDRIGGGLKSVSLTEPGFVHDLCSAFHPLAVTSPFFRMLPLESQGLQWVEPPICIAHPLDDGTAPSLYRSIEATAADVGGGRDARRYCQLMQPLARRWEQLFAELLAPLHLPRHPLLLARFGARAIRGGAGLARSLFRGSRGQALVAGVAAHSMVPIEKIASGAFAIMLMLAGHIGGWPFPRGGSQRLADAMAEHLRGLGGQIITGRPVDSFENLPRARVHLFDVTPRQLLAIAAEHLPPGYCRRLARYRYGPGVFKIDWALSEPIPWRAAACRQAGVVHVGGTLAEVAASERDMWHGRHSQRPFVLLGQQSLFDATRAPQSPHVRHTGWAYCHVPHGSTVDMTQVIEAQVERFAPGFRDVILARATHNTAQMHARNPNLVGGDISGGAFTLAQLFTRPVARACPYSTPNARLWICSASTPPGAGVHGMCGYHAAQAVLRKVFGRPS
jgi:phytoene dehydrogenase-like protein